MPTVREKELIKTWNVIRKKELISMIELEDFLDQVHKLVLNYRKTIESRDKWKAKFDDLKRNQKGGKK